MKWSTQTAMSIQVPGYRVDQHVGTRILEGVKWNISTGELYPLQKKNQAYSGPRGLKLPFYFI